MKEGLSYIASDQLQGRQVYTEGLGLIPDGPAKSDGQAVGLAAAMNIIALRSGDGRISPIGVTSSFPTLPPGPGVWRLTPPFAAPQTPWVGDVRPFVLQRLDQVLPELRPCPGGCVHARE